MTGIAEQLELVQQMLCAAALAGEPVAASAAGAHGSAVVLSSLYAWIPFLPLLGCALCGVFAALRVKSRLPAAATIGLLAASFVLTLLMYLDLTKAGSGGGAYAVVRAFEWINFQWGATPAQSLVADFSFYIDTLTCLWMLFVTGLATVIALYASEYMVHDVGLGYCRFFAAFGLFVFSMACLVMGDNLLLLFLGWEGVGLCSYLLIGYFYKKAPAVAAGKKAFIMNRIGDLGLSLGVMLTFVHFGTVEYAQLFPKVQGYLDLIAAGQGDQVPEMVRWIALLLTVGAFGKSAQIFFYVWLPDAMEGPTPVSALIHAATMVTAGVYLIARLYPVYLADEAMVALTVVAWSGAITALWAATIEMAIFDIKRVMGYSTISQLGFMFAALGLLSPVGAAYHTFTHAFFKATLFLGVGAVMHGFGGQLDLRRLSGVMFMRGFGLVGIAMLVGSISLAGVPFTAGYWSKDVILAQAFTTPGSMIAGAEVLAWVLLITAGMTAYYTFRTFMRVYVGPKEFLPGDDAELVDHGRHPKGTSLEEWHKQTGHGHGHGHGEEHAHAHGHGDHHDHTHHGHGHGGVGEIRLKGRVDFDPTTEEFDPHPPGTAMKGAIAICMALTLLAGGLYFWQSPLVKGEHWVGGLVQSSSATFESPGAHHGNHDEHVVSTPDHAGPGHGHEKLGTFLGEDPHKVMYYVSAGVGFIGILIAAFLHGPRGIWGLFIGNRTRAATSRADALVPLFGRVARWARAKWYVDEFYDAVVCIPLRVLAHVSHAVDKLLVDGLVNLGGFMPRLLGAFARRGQSGVMHDYALRMAAGVAAIVLVVLLVTGAAQAAGWGGGR